MTRTLKTLTLVLLGGTLLTTVACENKETEEALKTCKSDLGNEQKKEAAQQVTINELKAQLATAQAKVDELTKATESAKAGGKAGEEKGKASEAKKTGEAAKMEKKADKKAEKKDKQPAKK